MSQITFEVKRERISVTQGFATLYVCGKKIVTFGDNIEILHDGDTYYGPNIGGWASRTSDADFICGALNPKISYSRTEKIRADVLDAIREACEAGKEEYNR